MSGFDDPGLRAAMRQFLDAAAALEDAAEDCGAPGRARVVLDLAEQQALAGLLLRQRLVQLGWTAPTRSSTPAG